MRGRNKAEIDFRSQQADPADFQQHTESSLTQEGLWIRGSRATRRKTGGCSNGDRDEHQDHRVRQSILWCDTEKHSANPPVIRKNSFRHKLGGGLGRVSIS